VRPFGGIVGCVVVWVCFVLFEPFTLLVSVFGVVLTLTSRMSSPTRTTRVLLVIGVTLVTPISATHVPIDWFYPQF
jgi:hypothetical protein